MNNKAMRYLSYGLFVLTAKDGDKDNGCIINTAIQAASEPNQISIAVSKSNFTHDMIKKTGKFTISTISQEANFDLFKHFGFQSGKEVNKFADFSDCKRGVNDILYILKGINSFISVEVVQTADLGSHSMFIGTITDMEVLSSVPSATYQYYFDNIKPKPEAVGETKAGQTIWRCRICGYEYVGEELPEDYICPLCKHPASDFEKIEPKPKAGQTIWRCRICGYEYVGEELSEDYICPLCKHPASDFEKIEPKPKAGQTIWRCRICGYEYVGEELPEDYICPLCKHPASDFEKITK